MTSVNDFFLGLLSLVLWRIAFANTRNLQRFEQRFTSSYSLMSKYYTRNTYSSVSGMFCSTWCTKDKGCASFMFDAGTSKCKTFSNYFHCDSGGNKQRFYVKTGFPSCDCNPAYNSSLVNVALGKTATQSSTKYNLQAKNMVDGNRVYPWSHTQKQYYPYALIDLGMSYDVFSFYIVNRRGTYYWRLQYLKIFVGDDPKNLRLCINYPYTIAETCALRAPTTCQGRYVQIKLFAKQVLILVEFEVYSFV